MNGCCNTNPITKYISYEPSSKQKGLPIENWKCSTIYLFYVLCSLKMAYPFHDKKYIIFTISLRNLRIFLKGWSYSIMRNVILSLSNDKSLRIRKKNILKVLILYILILDGCLNLDQSNFNYKYIICQQKLNSIYSNVII